MPKKKIVPSGRNKKIVAKSPDKNKKIVSGKNKSTKKKKVVSTRNSKNSPNKTKTSPKKIPVKEVFLSNTETRKLIYSKITEVVDNFYYIIAKFGKDDKLWDIEDGSAEVPNEILLNSVLISLRMIMTPDNYKKLDLDNFEIQKNYKRIVSDEIENDNIRIYKVTKSSWFQNDVTRIIVEDVKSFIPDKIKNKITTNFINKNIDYWSVSDVNNFKEILFFVTRKVYPLVFVENGISHIRNGNIMNKFYLILSCVILILAGLTYKNFGPISENLSRYFKTDKSIVTTILNTTNSTVQSKPVTENVTTILNSVPSTEVTKNVTTTIINTTNSKLQSKALISKALVPFKFPEIKANMFQQLRNFLADQIKSTELKQLKKDLISVKENVDYISDNVDYTASISTAILFVTYKVFTSITFPSFIPTLPSSMH